MADIQVSIPPYSQHEMSTSSSTTRVAEEAQLEIESEPPIEVVPAAPRPPPLWKIHELPVPIRTFPLPSFYPSNPLSLFYVAYAWIRQALSPPPPEPSTVHQGVWSAKTRSVHITDSKSIRALWEQGFYGKGHLSRSEPNWFKREQARSGAHSGHVAEIHTVNRREERKLMKWDRAKKEQEAIHKTRLEEAWVAPVGPKELLALPNSQKELEAVILNGVANGTALTNGAVHEGYSSPPSDSPGVTEADSAFPSLTANGALRPKNTSSTPSSLEESRSSLKRRKSVRFSPKVESTTFQHSDPPSPHSCMGNGSGKVPDGILMNGSSNGGISLPQDSRSSPTESPAEKPDSVTTAGNTGTDNHADKEHLQLTLEETFWLTFGLGVLEVKDEITGTLLSVDSLFNICRQHSYFPPRTANLQPDDPFLVHYAVYHHFRSLGWVTRPGIKFGCDWLLYNRGPAFNHAEFAIVVLPSYSDPYWKTHGRNAPEKSWQWLHMINRVQSHALKTLVLVYVEIPAPASHILDIDGVDDGLCIPTILSRYKIKEFMVKRWLSNRNRD